jgi:hypothetical protein
MLKLDNIKIEVRKMDISGFVRGLTIYESIFGMLQGQIAVQDSTNFFDNFIGTELAGVDISFSYLDQEFACSFWMDGISDMKMKPDKKNYNIHLKSVHVPNFADTVNSVYNGTSDEIIAKIFADVSADDNTIAIDSRAVTSGRYIAPNIPAKECFTTLIANAYAVDQSGIFMYERFNDTNTVRITSLHDMVDNVFVDSSGAPVIVKQGIMDKKDLNPLLVLGTADEFEMREYSMNLIQKLEDGIYGEAINVINLDETKKTENITKEATSVPKTKFKLSDKLYANDVKSVLANRGDVASGTIINGTIRVFNTAMDVNNMTALPGLGCGMTVEVAMGGNEEQGTGRHDGKWLVKHIQHNLTQVNGEYNYYQNLGLVRE